MKKIVFFTARDLSNIGGGERMLSFLANRLSLKYDVTILTPYVSDSYFPLEESVKKVQYAQAELVNYRKRKDDEVASYKKYCNQDLITELIPIRVPIKSETAEKVANTSLP